MSCILKHVLKRDRSNPKTQAPRFWDYTYTYIYIYIYTYIYIYIYEYEYLCTHIVYHISLSLSLSIYIYIYIYIYIELDGRQIRPVVVVRQPPFFGGAPRSFLKTGWLRGYFLTLHSGRSVEIAAFIEVGATFLRGQNSCHEYIHIYIYIYTHICIYIYIYMYM